MAKEAEKRIAKAQKQDVVPVKTAEVVIPKIQKQKSSVSQTVPVSKLLAKTSTPPLNIYADVPLNDYISIIEDPNSSQKQVADALDYIRSLPARRESNMEAVISRIKMYGDPKTSPFPIEGSDSYHILDVCMQWLEANSNLPNNRNPNTLNTIVLPETANMMVDAILPFISVDMLENHKDFCVNSVNFVKMILDKWAPSAEIANNTVSTLRPMRYDPNAEDGMRYTIEGLICRCCLYNPAIPERESIMKTLFEDTGIMDFGKYPVDVVEHLYKDREKTTDKPIIFMVFTTRAGGSNFQFMAFNAADYKNLDIRVIEPGSDEKMVSLMKETSVRLGKKFSFLLINGHGNPSGVLLKSSAALSSNPETLDLEDGNLLNQIKPLITDKCDVVLNACSTAQDIGSMNLAEFVAKTLGARCYGASNVVSFGVGKIVFGANSTEITSVTYGNVLHVELETVVYDYRSTTGAKTMQKVDNIPAPLIKKTSLGYSITAAGAAECAIYDMKGRIITRLNKSKPDTFVWNASDIAKGNYIARMLMENKKSQSLIISVTK